MLFAQGPLVSHMGKDSGWNQGQPREVRGVYLSVSNVELNRQPSESRSSRSADSTTKKGKYFPKLLPPGRGGTDL